MGKIETAHERAKQAEPTIAEAHRAKSLAAHKRGAERRSKNTGVRTLEEVRATFHDATTQVGVLARKQGRADFDALAYMLGDVKCLLSPEPCTPARLEKVLGEIAHRAFRRALSPEVEAVHRSARDAAHAVDLRYVDVPELWLPVTPEGVSMLQRAVSERIAAGTLPPSPPPAADGTNVVSFDVARRRTFRPGAP